MYNGGEINREICCPVHLQTIRQLEWLQIITVSLMLMDFHFVSFNKWDRDYLGMQTQLTRRKAS